jgi:hypothetical protein
MEFGERELKRFEEEGYYVIEGYLSDSECDGLRVRCCEMINNEDFSQHPKITFNTTDNAQARNDYFITSGDKIRYFFEEGAVDGTGSLLVPKDKALNKIGHALHVYDELFRKVTFDDRIAKIAKTLQMINPVVVQSMYIFKQPAIGGSVNPHQDSAFLYTQPDSLIGFWIALEDADIENSCLWFRPGSHKGSLKSRMIRETADNGSLSTTITKQCDYTNDGYISCPVRKGTLVLIHGLVEHKSEANVSNRSRHIYTFHLYDAGKSLWSSDNWLQPSDSFSFPRLY